MIWYDVEPKSIYNRIWMVVDQNSFIPEQPFFANKKITFAKLSRTPCLSFAGPMLANNTSYEDSFTTCQITPENHGSLLGSLLNMQLASRNPFSGQIFLQSLLAHPLQHALWLSPARSHNFRGTFAKISLFTDPGHQQGVHWRKSEDQGPWCLALAKPHFWKLGYCYSHSLVPFSCRTPGGMGGSPLHIMIIIPNFRETFPKSNFTFASSKKTFARVSNITCTAFAIKTPYKDL